MNESKTVHDDLIEKAEYALAPMSVHLSTKSRRQTQDEVLRELLDAFKEMQAYNSHLIERISVSSYTAIENGKLADRYFEKLQKLRAMTRDGRDLSINTDRIRKVLDAE